MGLKAKPTKPVTEVLRPVVAKYGLDLGSLLVRLVSVIWSLSTTTRVIPHLTLSYLSTRFHISVRAAVLPRLGTASASVDCLLIYLHIFIMGKVDVCFR